MVTNRNADRDSRTAALARFGAERPDELAHLQRWAEKGDTFLSSLLRDVERGGFLSERQLNALRGHMRRNPR